MNNFNNKERHIKTKEHIKRIKKSIEESIMRVKKIFIYVHRYLNERSHSHNDYLSLSLSLMYFFFLFISFWIWLVVVQSHQSLNKINIYIYMSLISSSFSSSYHSCQISRIIIITKIIICIGGNSSNGIKINSQASAILFFIFFYYSNMRLTLH